MFETIYDEQQLEKVIEDAQYGYLRPDVCWLPFWYFKER